MPEQPIGSVGLVVMTQPFADPPFVGVITEDMGENFFRVKWKECVRNGKLGGTETVEMAELLWHPSTEELAACE